LPLSLPNVLHARLREISEKLDQVLQRTAKP
jgi:hypothetical protein